MICMRCVFDFLHAQVDERFVNAFRPLTDDAIISALGGKLRDSPQENQILPNKKRQIPL